MTDMKPETNDEVRLRALQVAARVQAEMEERFRAGGVVWVAEHGAPPRLMRHAATLRAA
jgi:predicted methyltransferase